MGWIVPAETRWADDSLNRFFSSASRWRRCSGNSDIWWPPRVSAPLRTATIFKQSDGGPDEGGSKETQQLFPVLQLAGNTRMTLRLCC